MIKALLEQWKANQEQKRAIARERWEQEKAWREEDRAATRVKKEEAEKERAEQEEEKKRQREKREEIDEWLYRNHLDNQHKAGAISYLNLVCHEDTWTYMARRAFGMWEVEWVTSQRRAGGDAPGDAAQEFTKDPNLTDGRITKEPNGMQTVQVSGANLITILDALYDHQWGVKSLYDDAKSAAWPLYKQIQEFLQSLDNKPTEERDKLVIDQRVGDAEASA